MAKRNKIRILEDWAGVDYFNSDLTRPDQALINAKNYQFAQGGALVGRRGFQVDGQRGGWRGGQVYSYLNTTSGATEEEVLIANRHLWRRVEGSFTITYSGAGTWFYQVSSLSAGYSFVLGANGGAAMQQSLGYGTEITPYSIHDLTVAIDALANFSCTIPTPWAQVNGAQSGVSTITVDAGHSLAARDFISLEDRATPDLVARIITSTTATTFTFDSAFGAVDVADNAQIGKGATPAASLRVRGASTSLGSTGSSAVVTYYYWEPIRFNYTAGYATYPFEWMYQAGGTTMPSFVNANDVCYIGQASRDIVPSYADADIDPDGKLLKYDGNRVYRAGMLKGAISSTSPSAGSGTYRYLVTREQIDHRGQIVEGEPSDVVSVTSATFPISVFMSCMNSGTGAEWFNLAGAIVNGAQSGAGTQTGLTVDSGHTLVAGDTAAIYDEVTSEIVTRVLTSTTATTLVWASTDAIQVSDNAPVSCNLRQKLWRTKDNGVDFYLVGERPNDYLNATVGIADSVADASLLIKYEFPETGREHNPPPALHYLALHQGCIIGAGYRGEPNTIYVSLPGDIEHFPTATSGIDIPSTVLGPITAIGSDSDNRLAVFKANGYYDIEGDIDLKSINVRAVNEGDYGVASHSSLVKIKDSLIGVGSLGPISVRNGQLNTALARAIRPKFTATGATGAITKAVAVNDSRNLMLRIWVEQYDLNGLLTIGGFVADYEDDALIWFPWDYGGAVNPNFGILNSSENLFHVTSGHAYREIAYVAEDQATAFFMYHDNCVAIDYVLKTTPFHAGEPSVDKLFSKLILYSLDSAIEDDYVSFTSTIKTYRNRSSTAHTSTSRTRQLSAGETAYEEVIKLKDGKARMLSVELQSNTIGHRPLWNGLELVYTNAYDEDEPAE
jgi:hypothetical protein